jgi:hypothetical protein
LRQAFVLRRIASQPDFGPGTINFDCLRDEDPAEPDAERHENQIIQIARDGYEVGDQFDRDERPRVSASTDT